MAQCYCEKCGKLMDEKEFYTSKNLEKYPNKGKLKQCKKCITMHVDNWDPSTYKWILQELDVPYVKEEWDKLLAKYGQRPETMTGMTILGRYLSTMALKQWKDKKWEDTDKIQEELRQRKINTMKSAGYSGTEIDEQLARDRTPDRPTAADPNNTNTVYAADDTDEFADKLTEDDKVMLTLKWGRNYRPSEWIKMEQLYTEMMASFDIQSPSHKDTLKMLCKTSLKANQLIDIGDVEGFQKMSKVYDQLMKSGNFTAVQNKERDRDSIDSLGELVVLCEEQGFIPRYHTDGPKDYADKVLADMQKYTKDLVSQETNLNNMVDSAMKMIQKDREREESIDLDIEDEDELLEKELFEESSENFLKDQDFIDFKEIEEEEALEDRQYLGLDQKGAK